MMKIVSGGWLLIDPATIPIQSGQHGGHDEKHASWVESVRGKARAPLKIPSWEGQKA